MIYLAGLQGIAPELYESAEIDGATSWKKFLKITLPQLSPVIFFNLIMGIIGSFQVFNQAYILFSMSGEVGRSYGGPEDSALFYVLQLYHKAFKEFQVGYASSLAWILFIIILIFTLLVFKSSPMWVYYEGKKDGKGI
jgi:multiple sugar transport system permease protein